MEKKIFPWQTKGRKKKKFGTKHFLFIFVSNGECFPHLKKGKNPTEKPIKAQCCMFCSFSLSLGIQSCHGDLCFYIRFDRFECNSELMTTAKAIVRYSGGGVSFGSSYCA